MDLSRPRFVFNDDLFRGRPREPAGVRFAGLWCVGSCAGLARPTVAIVGSRAPSAAGAARARQLGTALARAGICVISGLALGIDGASHLGALESGGGEGTGPTIGVLGGGHRQFFPKRNRELAERMIAAGGAVLSPFAPDEPARPPQFLQRNGVVAALADAVVVVEATARSGALNTATWASNLGIDVLAYPGDVDRPLAAGCNALIRDGATLVRHADDVFEALGLAARACADPSRNENDALGSEGDADPLQRAILYALNDVPRGIDDLVVATGAGAGEVLAAVMLLEIAGAIERRETECVWPSGKDLTPSPTRSARVSLSSGDGAGAVYKREGTCGTKSRSLRQR